MIFEIEKQKYLMDPWPILGKQSLKMIKYQISVLFKKKVHCENIRKIYLFLEVHTSMSP